MPVLFVTTGEAFADALAGGPAADALGGPILPVAKAGIPSPVLTEIDRLDPGRIVILGGPGAVSDAVATELQDYTEGAVTRVAGANRYATAANIALSGVFTAPAPQVLIATGLGFADALAGGAVGASTDSPVLLVAPDGLPPETAAALQALQPRDIAVLGGTNAVSDAVLQQLRSYTTGGVNRLSGADRYATAARLAQVFWPGTADVVYLAAGRNFPDALAGVPAAGLDRAPLLLLEPACMPAATRQELDRLQPTTVVVLGGPATVGQDAVAGAACQSAQDLDPACEDDPLSIALCRFVVAATTGDYGPLTADERVVAVEASELPEGPWSITLCELEGDITVFCQIDYESAPQGSPRISAGFYLQPQGGEYDPETGSYDLPPGVALTYAVVEYLGLGVDGNFGP